MQRPPSLKSATRALIRATLSLVWTSAPDGQIVDMPKWRAYTGKCVEQIKGWDWVESFIYLARKGDQLGVVFCRFDDDKLTVNGNDVWGSLVIAND
jgi:hypothetical protein